MKSSAEAGTGHTNLALWITVIVEGLMIIAVGAYNIYEIRRGSELVQAKIEGLAKYSARQGEKIDRMVTALEMYVGKKFTTEEATSTNMTATDQRIEKAIEFLEAWKKKDGKTQIGETNVSHPGRPETNRVSSVDDSRR